MSKKKVAQLIIETTGDLPAMPHVASQVLKKANDPNATAKDLHQIISQDQSLAARVLKLANSSYYARSRAITTLTDAVVIMGFNTVKSLVMASVTRELFKNFGLNEQLLWVHSIGSAVAARTIARKVRFPKVEEAFLTGLLHDIGITVLLLKLPKKMTPILEAVYNGNAEDFRSQEMEVLGFDHAHVGELLAEKWRFSDEIVEAIGLHHRPEEAQANPGLVRITYAANMFCHKLEIGHTRRPELDLMALEPVRALQLDAEVIESLLEEVRGMIASEMAEMFS